MEERLFGILGADGPFSKLDCKEGEEEDEVLKRELLGPEDGLFYDFDEVVSFVVVLDEYGVHFQISIQFCFKAGALRIGYIKKQKLFSQRPFDFLHELTYQHVEPVPLLFKKIVRTIPHQPVKAVQINHSRHHLYRIFKTVPVRPDCLEKVY